MVQNKEIDKPKSNNISQVPTDPKFNTLLRIIQQRPTELPDQGRDGSDSQTEWSKPTRKRPANDFLGTEVKPTLRSFVSKSRTVKDTFRAMPGTTRSAYLFVPQVHQDLKESKITYRITEVFISQAEIAKALSMWWRSKSGTRQFSSLESSQKQALAQMEAERGKLFPTRFMTDFIQYTSPRTFSSTTLSLKSHDIIVVIEEIDPYHPGWIYFTVPLENLPHASGSLPETVAHDVWPVRRQLGKVEGRYSSIEIDHQDMMQQLTLVGTETSLSTPESSERKRRSVHRLTWQRQKGEIARTSTEDDPVIPRSAEDFVDGFIKEFGILSL